jgi:hypothetical protein
MKFRWQISSLGVAVMLAIGLMLPPTSTALARQQSVARVSGPSPYAGCTLAGLPGAVNYINAEVEPYVDVNPRTIGSSAVNLVGVWQQDVWSTRSAHGGVAAFSFDGGNNWGETTLPFTGCAPNAVVDPATRAPWTASADNWVSFGPDGIAYTSATAGSTVNLDNSVDAASSADGGKTWQNATVVEADTGTTSGPTHFFNDKDAVTADPTRPGTAYLVWDRLESPNGFPVATRSLAFTGPTLLSKTGDGGKTWSGAKIIVPTGQNNQTIDNQVVVAPNGTLYDFFDLILTTGPDRAGALSIKQHGLNVAFVKSTDGGATWTTPQIIAKLESVGVTDPNTGTPITTGDIASVSASIDPTTGTPYVAWQDARFNGGRYDEVAVSFSADGGAHWSAPARANTPTGRPAFDPALKVAADGTVGLTYYDFRNLSATNTSTLPTNYWLRKAPAGGTAFGIDIPVIPADEPFDMLAAPSVARGPFVGDYMGLTAVGSVFHPLFVATNCSSSSCATGPNPTDVFAIGL